VICKCTRVRIELERLGNHKVVPDTDAAARLLVFDWPREEGHVAQAKAACFAVRKGAAEPDTERDAFVAAAAEAYRSVRISRG